MCNQAIFLVLRCAPLTIRVALQSEITRIHRELGVTIVFITHDIREALTLGSRVIVMKDGQIEQDGTPGEIRQSPRTDFVRELIN